MNTLFLAANNGMGNIWTIVIFILLIALMYFTMIKPQKKQQQQKAEMMNQLKKGDSVIMIDGLHGKIDSVNTKDKTVIVDADGIYLTFSRMAVQQILPANTNTPAPETSTSADESAAETENPAAPEKTDQSEADATTDDESAEN